MLSPWQPQVCFLLQHVSCCFTDRFSFVSFSFSGVAFGILVPRQGSNLGRLQWKLKSPCHWTPREFPVSSFIRHVVWPKRKTSVSCVCVCVCVCWIGETWEYERIIGRKRTNALNGIIPSLFLSYRTFKQISTSLLTHKLFLDPKKPPAGDTSSVAGSPQHILAHTDLDSWNLEAQGPPGGAV